MAATYQLYQIENLQSKVNELAYDVSKEDNELLKAIIAVKIVLAQRLVTALQTQLTWVEMDGTLTVAEAKLLRADRQRNKIPVIKSVRERANLGLADAKHLVEQWLANAGYGSWDSYTKSYRDRGY